MPEHVANLEDRQIEHVRVDITGDTGATQGSRSRQLGLTLGVKHLMRTEVSISR